jgi:uncharacterized damage-inducible protein DinB
MTYYGAKQLADNFRTVRKNTLAIAEEIPAEQYDFMPAPGLRSVAQQLAHIAVNTRWAIEIHSGGATFIDFATFGQHLAQAAGEEAMLRTKDDILDALRKDGETYAAFLGSLTDDRLGEMVGFPAPLQPPQKSRFEMLLGVKEHEMHHRAQLMLIQRLLGMVPHLTRQREAMAGAVAAGKA